MKRITCIIAILGFIFAGQSFAEGPTSEECSLAQPQSAPPNLQLPAPIDLGWQGPCLIGITCDCGAGPTLFTCSGLNFCKAGSGHSINCDGTLYSCPLFCGLD